MLAGELRATLLGNHNTAYAAGVKGAGGTGGPGCGARGRRRGLAGLRTTRPAIDQPPCATVVEGAGGSGGHGRASRSTTPSDSKACGDLAGGRAQRRPEHQRHHKHPATTQRKRAAAPGPPRVHATSSALSAVERPRPRRPGQHSGRRPCAGCRQRRPG